MLTVGVDSYISISEADDIISKHIINPSVWDSLETKGKEILLRRAAYTIDNMKIAGKKHSENQLMAFPRNNYTYVPQDIMIAQALEAYAMTDAQTVMRTDLKAQGVTSVKLGNTAESYDINFNTATNIYSSLARHILSRYVVGSAAIV